MQISLKLRIASAMIGLAVLSSATMGILSRYAAQSQLIGNIQNHLQQAANSATIGAKLISENASRVVTQVLIYQSSQAISAIWQKGSNPEARIMPTL